MTFKRCPVVLGWWPVLLTPSWPHLGWDRKGNSSLLCLSNHCETDSPLYFTIANSRIKRNKILLKVGSEWKSIVQHIWTGLRVPCGAGIHFSLHLPSDVKRTFTYWSLGNIDYLPKKRRKIISDLSIRPTSRVFLLCPGLITWKGIIHSLLGSAHQHTYNHMVYPEGTSRTVTAQSEFMPLGANTRWRPLHS